MASSALVLRDASNAIFLDKIVKLGDLSESIDVLALFRCKGCGLCGINLELLTEHLSNAEDCKNVQIVLQEGETNNPSELQEMVFSGDTNIGESVVTNDQSAVIPDTKADICEETVPVVKKKRGRPRKVTVKEEDLVENACDKDTIMVEELPEDCEPFLCPFCPENFMRYNKLHEHQQIHIAEKLRNKRSNSNYKRPTRAIKTDDKNKPVPCPICPLEFLTGYNVLQQHFTCHFPDKKRFKCPWCEMGYKTWRRMFLHLGEHDENDLKKISGIVRSNGQEAGDRPRILVDEDEYSDNEDSKDEDEVYTPEKSFTCPTDKDPFGRGQHRRRKRPRKNEKPNYKVMPFPGLDGVFVIGDANQRFEMSNVKADYDGDEKSVNGTSAKVDKMPPLEEDNQPSTVTGDEIKLSTPPSQTLDDLIEAIETEEKRQKLERELKEKLQQQSEITDSWKEPLKSENLVAETESESTIETYWISPKPDHNRQTSETATSGENKENKVMSFCPHCVLTRGARTEISLHKNSHCLEEDTFFCVYCPNETPIKFSLWGNLRNHYERSHSDKVDWPSISKWAEKQYFYKNTDIPQVSRGFGVKRYTRYGKSQKMKRVHRCSRCKTVFLHSSEEVELHNSCHLEDHKEGFRCNSCPEEFETWFETLTHIVDIHHDGEPFSWQKPANNVCPFCGIVKRSPKHVQDHIRSAHKKQKNFRCKMCNASFRFYLSWKRHEERHQPKGTWKCEICGYVAKHSYALNTHINIKHENKGFPCPYCKYQAPLRHNLEKHIFMVHEFDGHMAMCDICGQQFKNKSSVVNHVRRKHSNNPTLLCEFCDFETNDKVYLRAHIQKKHEPKKYKCSFCPYGTMQEQALQTHLRTHTEHRPYVCSFEDCYFRARDQKTLSSHFRNSHTNDESTRKHTCATCGKSFKTATILKHHMPVHTGEMPHCCFYCPFRAKHRSTVHRHMIKVHKHQHGDRLTTLTIVDKDGNNDETAILSQDMFNEIVNARTESGALIVDESTMKAVNQAAQGIENGEETTTILVMPMDGMDHVQAEVVVGSQNAVQHETAVQILQQLMQMADGGNQTTTLDMADVLQAVECEQATPVTGMNVKVE